MQYGSCAAAASVNQFGATQNAIKMLLQHMGKIAAGYAEPVVLHGFSLDDHGCISGSTRTIIYYNACEIPRVGLSKRGEESDEPTRGEDTSADYCPVF
jgi:hypothetical protein